MDADIVALLGGDPANPVASLAEAFRRKRGLAALGMATGDPAMASLGKELAGEAQHGTQEAIQSKHFDIQGQQLANTLRHQQELEEQGRVRLDQGDERIRQRDATIEAMNRGLALKGVRFNPNTGEFENIAGKAGPARRALPLATGAGAMPSAVGAPPAAPVAAPLGKWQDKALKELGADFNPSSGRAGEFGKNQARVNAAGRLLALAEDEHGNPINLTPNQMPELAQSLANLISTGGTGAQSQIEHLTPHSLRGDFAKIAQWITNEPQGADQQAFVKNMADTAKREQAIAQQAIEAVRGQLGAKHQRILRSNKEEARKVLQGFGWDLGPDGMPVLKAPPKAGPSPDDAQAIQWLKDNPQHPSASKVAAKLKAKGLLQ